MSHNVSDLGDLDVRVSLKRRNPRRQPANVELNVKFELEGTSVPAEGPQPQSNPGV